MTNKIINIASSVTNSFSEIAEVISVYQDLDDGEIIFWVFTDEKQYDDELMDRLITLEVAILNQYTERSIMFRYIPLRHVKNERCIVGSIPKKIFGSEMRI